INAGKTTHQGLELSLNYPLVQRNLVLNAFANYHYANYRFTEFVDDDTDYSGNELTGTPPHSFNLGLDGQWVSTGLYGHLDFRLLDAMPMRDDNSVYSEAWQTINLKLGWQSTFADHWGLDVYAGINNLLDEKYASMILINAGSFGGRAPRYYYPGLPRNFYAGAKLRYQF
ncbi:MAG: TonB-dependent receptor, partial [Bacteroidota bacterium]